MVDCYCNLFWFKVSKNPGAGSQGHTVQGSGLTLSALWTPSYGASAEAEVGGAHVSILS